MHPICQHRAAGGSKIEGGVPTKIDYRKKGTLLLTSLLEDLDRCPFSLSWLKLDGTGVDWFHSIYQGHLFLHEHDRVREWLMVVVSQLVAFSRHAGKTGDRVPICGNPFLQNYGQDWAWKSTLATPEPPSLRVAVQPKQRRNGRLTGSSPRRSASCAFGLAPHAPEREASRGRVSAGSA